MKAVPEALLIQLLVDVLNIPPETISPDTSFGDFPDWDSMSYIQLIMALESELGIKLSHADVLELDSLKKLEKILRKYGIEVT